MIGITAGYLEFSGQGLTTFERALDRDEKLMAVLGSRLLEPQKKVAESAEALRLRQVTEGSLLARMIKAVSRSLTRCLQWLAWWHGEGETAEQVSADKASIELNTDFQTAGLKSMEIIAIVQARQAGAMSRDQMEGVFCQGELLPETGLTEPRDKETLPGNRALA